MIHIPPLLEVILGIGAWIHLIETTVHFFVSKVKPKEEKIHQGIHSKARYFSSTTYKFILSLLILIICIILLMQENNWTVAKVISDNKQSVMEGLATTIIISSLSIVFGTLIGVAVALILAVKKTRFWMFIDSIINIYLYVLLGTPTLILLWLASYIVIKDDSAWLSSLVALSINLSPFVAKIVYASLENIPREQIDAATIFGYDAKEILWYFKFKFILRNSLQSLLVEYYTTIKLSSLAGIIGLTEIFHQSKDIIFKTQDPISGYIILAFCYVFVIAPIAVFADYMENKWKTVQNN